MTRQTYFVPRFVELMPPALEPGVLYISTAYSLMSHLCASGCGEKVVLPLHPQQWRFTYDGHTASVYPSVGNVGTACNSHYWIRHGEVEWSGEITAKQARLRHERDRRDLELSDRSKFSQSDQPIETPITFLQRLRRIFSHRR